MIISDEHRFAFIHVPKCGGLSITNQIKALDSYDGYFTDLKPHPSLGMTHYSHLTLREFETYFPEVYVRVAGYRTLAIVRAPQARFISALHQRLREFRGLAQYEITDSVLAEEAKAVQAYLSTCGDTFDLEHTHFKRQADFIFDREGRRVVEKVTPLTRLNEAAEFIAQHTGLTLRTDSILAGSNTTLEIPNPGLRSLIAALRPRAAFLPRAAQERIRDGLIKAGVYRRWTGQERAAAEILPPDVRDFVADYYAADYRLYEAAEGKVAGRDLNARGTNARESASEVRASTAAPSAAARG